jgi:hypothetical protein
VETGIQFQQKKIENLDCRLGSTGLTTSLRGVYPELLTKGFVVRIVVPLGRLGVNSLTTGVQNDESQK